MKWSWNSRRSSFCLAVVLIGLTVVDLQAQVFVPAGRMTRSRIWHSATLLQDGRVLIAGGESTASAEIYDPDSGTFVETGGMTSVRYGHSAVLLLDGRVLIVGGFCKECPINAELYNPGTGEFTTTGNMSVAQYVGAAALLRNGKVLVVGSVTAELFDPASETFVPLGKGRLIYSATLLVDGTVLLLGVTEASIFDPAANQFRNLRSVPNTDLRGIPAVALLEGSVLFAAAGDPTYYLSTYYKDSALYDPVTQTFKPAPYLTQPRDGGTATLLKDGRVLVAGGFNGEGPAAYNGILGSAEMYDAATRKVSLLRANMVLHRYIHRATLLRDGRVLITGGYTAPSNLPLVDDTFAELFVPENTQGAVPRLSVDRTQYCVGDSWFLRGDAVNPGAAVQISGTWDEMPWTIPNWTSSDRDGALVGTGTFGAVTIGNHTIWIQAGGKVSNSVFIRVGDCSVHPD